MRLKPRTGFWASTLVVGLLIAGLGRPALHLARATLRDPSDRPPPPAGSIDDASGLSQTAVREVFEIPVDPAAAETQLADLLRRARQERTPVSIAGARHSMGGHALRKDGIVLDMRPFRAMRLDAARNILYVQAGALWSEVVPYLNATGRSVAVMQSNNSFTVGGSLSVNCHGWQTDRPPIASTVESIRVLLADGRVVRCSRTENGELFSLVLGGYGLFGVILDAELRVVPNEEYRSQRFVIPVSRLAAEFEERVRQGTDVGMAYGRLSVAPESLLQEAILTVFHRIPASAGQPSAIGFPEVEGLTRAIFRGQVGSDYGKSLRWAAEKRLGGALSPGGVHRNQLLSEPVGVFENRSAGNTDVLHEYFVPPAQLEAFVEEIRPVMRRARADLLNVTVRDVRHDDDTLLRYADRDLLALVMLFHQPRTPEGDADMQSLTRELIDAALRCGGRYYLPYRLHATDEQFHAAYPQAERFFALKKRYDPDEVFQNTFYLRYARHSDR